MPVGQVTHHPQMCLLPSPMASQPTWQPGPGLHEQLQGGSGRLRCRLVLSNSSGLEVQQITLDHVDPPSTRLSSTVAWRQTGIASNCTTTSTPLTAQRLAYEATNARPAMQLTCSAPLPFVCRLLQSGVVLQRPCLEPKRAQQRGDALPLQVGLSPCCAPFFQVPKPRLLLQPSFGCTR